MITFLLEHLTVNLNSTIVASQKNKSMRTFYEPIEQYILVIAAQRMKMQVWL
jgi:hypothetical protein